MQRKDNMSEEDKHRLKEYQRIIVGLKKAIAIDQIILS